MVAQVRMCHVDTGANNHQDLPWGGNIVEGINYASDQSSSDFSDMYAGNAKGCKCPKDSHGTHTAGLLAASSNNGKGVAGVAWKVGSGREGKWVGGGGFECGVQGGRGVCTSVLGEG